MMMDRPPFFYLVLFWSVFIIGLLLYVCWSCRSGNNIIIAAAVSFNNVTA